MEQLKITIGFDPNFLEFLREASRLLVSLRSTKRNVWVLLSPKYWDEAQKQLSEESMILEKDPASTAMMLFTSGWKSHAEEIMANPSICQIDVFNVRLGGWEFNLGRYDGYFGDIAFVGLPIDVEEA